MNTLNVKKEIWYSKRIAGDQKNVEAAIIAYTDYSNISFSRFTVVGNGGIIFTPTIHLKLEIKIIDENPLHNQIDYSFCIPGYAIGPFNKVCHNIRTAVSSSVKEALDHNEVLRDLRFSEDNIDKIHKHFYFVFKKFEGLVLSYPLIYFDMVRSLKDYETYKSTLEGYTNQYLDTYYKNDKINDDILEQALPTISDFIGKDNISITVLDYDNCLYDCIDHMKECLSSSIDISIDTVFEPINKTYDGMMCVRNLGIRNIKNTDIIFAVCPSEEISEEIESYIKELIGQDQVIFIYWVKDRDLENSKREVQENVKISFDKLINLITKGKSDD